MKITVRFNCYLCCSKWSQWKFYLYDKCNILFPAPWLALSSLQRTELQKQQSKQSNQTNADRLFLTVILLSERCWEHSQLFQIHVKHIFGIFNSIMSVFRTSCGVLSSLLSLVWWWNPVFPDITCRVTTGHDITNTTAVKSSICHYLTGKTTAIIVHNHSKIPPLDTL